MGRTKKSTVLKKLEGTYRSDRSVKNEMNGRVVTSLPRAPQSLDKFGRRAWAELGPRLIKSHVLQDVDMLHFEFFCTMTGYIIEDIELIKKAKSRTEQYTNKAGATNIVLSAHRRNLQLDFKIWSPMAHEFGLSPAARTKISIPKAESTNPIMELFD